MFSWGDSNVVIYSKFLKSAVSCQMRLIFNKSAWILLKIRMQINHCQFLSWNEVPRIHPFFQVCPTHGPGSLWLCPLCPSLSLQGENLPICLRSFACAFSGSVFFILKLTWLLNPLVLSPLQTLSPHSLHWLWLFQAFSAWLSEIQWRYRPMKLWWAGVVVTLHWVGWTFPFS